MRSLASFLLPNKITRESVGDRSRTRDFHLQVNFWIMGSSGMIKVVALEDRPDHKGSELRRAPKIYRNGQVEFGDSSRILEVISFVVLRLWGKVKLVGECWPVHVTVVEELSSVLAVAGVCRRDRDSWKRHPLGVHQSFSVVVDGLVVVLVHAPDQPSQSQVHESLLVAPGCLVHGTRDFQTGEPGATHHVPELHAENAPAVPASCCQSESYYLASLC